MIYWIRFWRESAYAYVKFSAKKTFLNFAFLHMLEKIASGKYAAGHELLKAVWPVTLLTVKDSSYYRPYRS